MKIFIVSMDDPLYTIPFIKDIIDDRLKDIVGLAVAKGDRLKIGKSRSKIIYVISLALIMGPFYFISNSFKTVLFKVKINLSKLLPFVNSPSILAYAKLKEIRTYEIDSPNSKTFLKELRTLQPEVIINQSQHILKKDFLLVPQIGVINRHNALLPKNRGRLTPFWVLFKKEEETGVSIHFVAEGIDSGDIIVQKKFKVEKSDTFKSIVTKNYNLASKAMLEALSLLEKGDYSLIPNENSLASYNSVPTLSDALKFRLARIISF